MKENVTIDPKEIAHFSAMADEWWDANGKFKPLHEINPVRLQFIRDNIARHFGRDIKTTQPFSKLSMVD
ncbi:MAG: bifunctional 3-demethylubiquinol 3-O-methyltransferase/2-polyprenyl-6-hydroxyphenol methylase, partial [Rickettsiales bacterium]